MARAAICVALALLALTAIPTAQAWNAGANGTAAMGASLFNKIFTTAIPILEEVGPSITIGPFSGSHYKVGTFHLNKLDISSMDVAFVNPNKLQLTIHGLAASIPSTSFSVFAKIFDETVDGYEVGPDFKIHCDGHVSGATHGASATMDIDLSTNADGKLVATVGTPSLDVGDPSISTHMDGFCKVAGAIIDLFKKLIVKEVRKEANKLLPAKLQHILQKEMTKFLPKVPLHFASQPTVVSDHMDLDIQLVPPSNGLVGGALVSSVGPAQVQPHIFNDKDISIGISTNSFDDLVASLASSHGFDFNHTFHGKYNTSIFSLFIPQVYAKCPDCPFAVYFAIQKNSPPTATFGQEALQFDFTNVELNFTAMSTNGGAEEDLFSAFANLSFGLTNFTVMDQGEETLVKFDVALNSFSIRLGYSFIGHIHLSKFGQFVDGTFKDLLLPLFNAGFKGFPLKLAKDGFGLESWKVDLHQDAISLGANLLLPDTMGIMRALLRGKF